MRRERDREFTEFVGVSGRRLARFAAALMSERADAEDVLQSALLKAYMNWWRVRGDPVAYVRRIILNERSDTFARAHRQREVLAEDIPEHGSNFDKPDEFNRLDLVRALGELDARSRALVYLRYYEDLDLAQCAEEMRLPLNTVKSILHRSMRKLRLAPELVSDLSPSRPEGVPK